MTKVPANLPLAGPSPQNPSMLRVEHATGKAMFRQPAEVVFNAFTRWAGYERWSDLQGPAHWLSVRKDGPGSRFVLYDKPGPRHLANFGVVTDLSPATSFAWQAPFSEWPRATIGSTLELTATENGGTEATERLYFEAREDHLPALFGFLQMEGFDAGTFERFLAARLSGLAALLDERELSEEERSPLFTHSRQVAADWSGRVVEGDWVRVLYADGEVEFDAPVETVFNAFTRFARYPVWTPEFHVGAEWLDVRAGGPGSRFLLWEKPAGRQVMHQAVVTELERNRKFTWRAPFAEWGKVFIGTSFIASPRPDGGTHVYHVLYTDLPREYLPVFAGFGTLPGFDLEFETFHIHEEARGFRHLLQSDAFSDEDSRYLFARNQAVARDWPLQDGRPWPEETLTLQPTTTMTYEELLVVVSEMLADSVPSPAFLRRYRDLRRTRAYDREQADSAGAQ